MQVSALKLQPRTSVPDFADLGLLATRDDERGVHSSLRRCPSFVRSVNSGLVLLI